jgi:hypothetical protein
MTPFYPRQSARGRSDRQTATDDTLQIHVANCNKKLHARIHETRKIRCNNWQGAGQAYAAELKFYARQALPLGSSRFLRLAQSSPMIARSPASWQRDGRAISGKIAGKMSRGIAAQLPGNGWAVAAAMPPNVRQDDSQDSLPCARLGRAMSALETCETTRNWAAQQPRSFPAMAGHCRRTSVKTTRKTTCLAPNWAAPCPRRKLARRLATWPRSSQGNI